MSSSPSTDGQATEGRAARPPLAIVDIDGVVADVRHRLVHLERRPKDWDAFFAATAADPVHPEGVEVVNRLRQDHEVVYLTGRPPTTRQVTLDWLERHGLGGHRLVMRPGGDRRSGAAIKLELLRGLAFGRTVGLVVDDDERVITAMRDAGYPTFHATWERRSADDRAAIADAQGSAGAT